MKTAFYLQSDTGQIIRLKTEIKSRIWSLYQKHHDAAMYIYEHAKSISDLTRDHLRIELSKEDWGAIKLQHFNGIKVKLSFAMQVHDSYHPIITMYLPGAKAIVDQHNERTKDLLPPTKPVEQQKEETPTKPTLSALLSKHLEEQQDPSGELANLTGISQPYAVRILAGECDEIKPGKSTLKKVHAIFNITEGDYK